MSTDDHPSIGTRSTTGSVLEHPLIGLERRQTGIAAAYLAVLIGLFAISYTGSAVTIDGAALDTVVPGFDAISSWLIIIATVTIAIVPFLYAAWNGGPAVAFVLPLVPVLLGDIAAGQYVLGTDTAIALTVGAAASALALVAADIRRTRSLRPWRAADSDDSQLLVVTILTVVAAISVGRFVAGVPPRYLEWYAPFGALWLVPLTVVGCYWGAAVRTTVVTRTDRVRTDS